MLQRKCIKWQRWFNVLVTSKLVFFLIFTSNFLSNAFNLLREVFWDDFSSWPIMQIMQKICWKIQSVSRQPNALSKMAGYFKSDWWKMRVFVCGPFCLFMSSSCCNPSKIIVLISYSLITYCVLGQRFGFFLQFIRAFLEKSRWHSQKCCTHLRLASKFNPQDGAIYTSSAVSCVSIFSLPSFVVVLNFSLYSWKFLKLSCALRSRGYTDFGCFGWQQTLRQQKLLSIVIPLQKLI